MTNWIGFYTFIKREFDRTLRVSVQTLVTPWISAALYIFIFGFVVGKKIEFISGVPYINFVLPGVLMMNVIASAFGHSSSSLYFARFMKSIEEILVAPLSYFEMVMGYVVSGVVRSVIVGVGILFIGVLFGAAEMQHFSLFIMYVASTAAIFSLLGLLVGLWANGFEQLNMLNTFVITPLSFLGGIFYSVTMLPSHLQFFAYLNPFFYFIDGIRYSMIGIRESNQSAGIVIILFLFVSLTSLIIHLFRIGWRLRE